MAISWLTVLKIVPWAEVISNAPKVVDGARKLWSAVAKKPSASDGFQAVSEVQPQLMASLEARTGALEAAVVDLQGQMVASSELIKALADQNAQLIQRIETNRVRLLWLSAATAVAATTALLGLLLVFRHHGA